MGQKEQREQREIRVQKATEETIHALVSGKASNQQSAFLPRAQMIRLSSELELDGLTVLGQISPEATQGVTVSVRVIRQEIQAWSQILLAAFSL